MLQFNLEVEELEYAQREVEHWRRDPTCPMMIEVTLNCQADRGCRCLKFSVAIKDCPARSGHSTPPKMHVVKCRYICSRGEGMRPRRWGVMWLM